MVSPSHESALSLEPTGSSSHGPHVSSGKSLRHTLEPPVPLAELSASSSLAKSKGVELIMRAPSRVVGVRSGWCFI